MTKGSDQKRSLPGLRVDACLVLRFIGSARSLDKAPIAGAHADVHDGETTPRSTSVKSGSRSAAASTAAATPTATSETATITATAPAAVVFSPYLTPAFAIFAAQALTPQVGPSRSDERGQRNEGQHYVHQLPPPPQPPPPQPPPQPAPPSPPPPGKPSGPIPTAPADPAAHIRLDRRLRTSLRLRSW